MPTRTGPRAALVVLLLVVLAAACGTDDTASAPPDGERPPNIVVIMTDDQVVDEMQFLPQTRALLAREGTTFLNSFVSFPLCCPSRATQLTGQYAHNHGVRNNAPPDGGADLLDHSQTLPVWLLEGGYNTALVGKYLNGYGETSAPYVPPGYTDWFGLIDPTTTRYFNYQVNDRGTVVDYGDAEADYQTDVLADRAVADIEDFTAQGAPFYMNIWTLAPHTGTGATQPNQVAPAPAPRHLDLYPDLTYPRGPAFFEEDVSDKPPSVQRYKEGLRAEMARQGVTMEQANEVVDETYRARAQSLAAVDDLVARVVGTLEEQGVLDDTIVVFTSDNGWLFGQHNLPFGKVVFYEDSARVPLLVRGPGFPAGETVADLVVNVDLPATFMAASGIEPGLPLDGRDLRPLAAGEGGADRAVLLEQYSLKPHQTGVRVPGFVYWVSDTDEVELYDLIQDPDQLENVAGDPAYASVQERLEQARQQLVACAGESCQLTIPPDELRRAPDAG